MYILKETTKEKLALYKKKAVCSTIGIHPDSLRKMLKENKPCNKQTAYCITKFLNCEVEIEDMFERK